MTTHPLPVIDETRTEFGFPRTICACAECTNNCRHMPGYLIPADLDGIAQHLSPGEDLLAWAGRYLLASPGALVARGRKIFRIPTLVPARRFDRACAFLTVDDRCAIHAIAPFGCAFFDSHMNSEEADRRSTRGLHAIMEAWARNGRYAQFWLALDSAGLRSSTRSLPATNAAGPPVDHFCSACPVDPVLSRKVLPMRLAVQMRGGFYPAHEKAIAHAAAFLQTPAHQLFAILDPCAGEGAAIRQLAELLGSSCCTPPTGSGPAA